MRSTRWTVFGTARFSQRSQKPAIYRRTVSLLQRASGSLHRQFDTIGTWAATFPNINLFFHQHRLDPPKRNPSKLWLLMACTDEQLSMISVERWPDWRVANYQRYKISTMTTWVKGCQLLTIRVRWQPEWRVASYRKYEYNDDLSEKLPVINNTSIMTTWVKGCQLSTISIQKQPEWKVASYQWHTSDYL